MEDIRKMARKDTAAIVLAAARLTQQGGTAPTIVNEHGVRGEHFCFLELHNL